MKGSCLMGEAFGCTVSNASIRHDTLRCVDVCLSILSYPP